MFTDAVSFSAQMNAQEVATLNRMERDMEVMRRIALAHSGVVLKSTGDGLLIRFGSAVQAVSCALEIQQGFAPRRGPAPAGGDLRHRVGIHLGDVFVHGDDVMGDGVNIAARLVAEAPPGGIIISQVVHEVVKNKLSLQAVPLGPRHLRNIKDPILLYRLQLDEPAPVRLSAPAPATAAPVPPDPPTASRGSPKRLMALGTLVVAGAAAWFVLRAQRDHERELRESQATQAALAGLLKQDAAGAPAAAEGETAGILDFAQATTPVPAPQRVPAEPPERLREAQELVATLQSWVDQALAGHTRARPLRVDGLGDPAFLGTTLFMEGEQLYFAEGGAFRRRAWTELEGPAQAAVIASLLRASPTAPPPEVRRGAGAFAYLHGRPELARALR